MSLMNPERAASLVDQAVEEMIGRGDMSPEEIQVSCVLSAMARLIRADNLPEGIKRARWVIDQAIYSEYDDNRENWE